MFAPPSGNITSQMPNLFWQRQSFNGAGPHWIQMQIAAELQQIPVGLYQPGTVAALHQMPPPLMTAVEPDHVASSKVLHESAEVGVGCFNQQVRMVFHQGIEVQDDTVSQDTGAQGIHKPATIFVVPDNGPAFVPPQCDVV